MVERQSDRKLTIMRTDGDGEYVSKYFDMLCEKDGILHEVVPPYPLHHNETAKKNNITIMNMVLEVVACCFLDAGSVAAFDTSLWKLEKPKLVQEVKVHFGSLGRFGLLAAFCGYGWCEASDVVRGTALIDVYVKCGFLGEAMDIFERMKSKDVKSWTAVISGHGIHEQPMEAIRLYKRMDNERFRPNEVTFLAILTAGSHGGLVNEGIEFF
ncbi:pentatricopeptide repeat-containing protein At3g18970 [Lathyrus oleraceus]|uniref:pentatricopeptide repeat-containing protein At3g18970 n=1 Tax=Pisum sativum TaxID=3888 RepID=UPI0021D29C27|nr:pentatricopeptide repeat-containing protein At3g18970-like [Pisum sativum]